MPLNYRYACFLKLSTYREVESIYSVKILSTLELSASHYPDKIIALIVIVQQN